jgi:hypothetical protein
VFGSGGNVLEVLVGALLIINLMIFFLLWLLLRTGIKLRNDSLKAQLSLEKLLLSTTAEMVRAIEELQRTRKGA